MALQLNDATAIINRTTNLVAATSSYTVMFWYRPGFLATAPAYIAPFALTNAGYTAYARIISDPAKSDGAHQLEANNGGGASITTDQILAASQNVHVAYVREGTSNRFYINGKLIGTATEDMSAVTFAELLLGNDRSSVISSPILFWDFKEWEGGSSVFFIREEMASHGAVTDTTGLRAFTPLTSSLNDTSGNGNHWTGAGNYSFVSTPSLPTNTTAANATLVSSLPYSASPGSTYNLPLWYKFVATVGQTYLGAFGFGGLGDYTPSALVWALDGTSLVEWPNPTYQAIGVNVPVQFPVVPGDTYYVEFRSDFGGIGGSLTVAIRQAPSTTPPAGSILITAEDGGYGAAIISGEDGDVLRFVTGDMPASNTGVALLEGTRRILLVDDITGEGPELYLFDPDLTLVATVARGTDAAIAVTTNYTDIFYIFYDPPGAVSGYVMRLSDDGEFIDLSTQIGPITTTAALEMGSMAVSPDETILYYQLRGTNQGAIRRWDITNNVALSDIVAAQGLGWFGIEAMLVLPSGDIIAGQDQFLSGSGGFLRRYTPAGATVWSYDLGSLGIDYHGVRMVPSEDWPDSFLLVAHFSSGHSRFITINAATGAEISSFEVPTFSVGAYQPAESATPEAEFGSTPSCAYILTTSALANVDPGVIGPYAWVECRRRVP